MDPNQLIGPAGYGVSNYVSRASLFAYRVDFENRTNATGPAQIVSVVNPLSSDLDASTFEITEVGFANRLFAVPSGSRRFEAVERMTQDGVDFEVHVEVGIRNVNEVYAIFTSRDPLSGLPPSGPNGPIGFLLPETVPPSGVGQGHLTYVIRPLTNAPSGTQIRNIARIRFDSEQELPTNLIDASNPSLGTSPTNEALVTIDADLPTSAITAATPTGTNYALNVAWTGSDMPSGLAGFDIYVSTNGGAWGLWLTSTTNTSGLFAGQRGQTYGFYSAAADRSGNRQPPPTNGTPSQASATIPQNLAPILQPIPDFVANVRQSLVFTNLANDLDVPANLPLTFSLDAGGPLNAIIETNTGVFYWTPLPFQASTTNLITVRVTDKGVPQASSTRTFKVVVNEFVEPGLGSQALLAGQTGNLPITLISSVGIRKLNFTLLHPEERLTNWTFLSTAPQVQFTNLLRLGPDAVGVFLTNFAGQGLQGTQQVAVLRFDTVPDQSSAFVPLLITNIYAERTDGSQSTNVFIQSGRVVIINREPLMEAWETPTRQRMLRLYGRPGTNYVMEFRIGFNPTTPWTTNSPGGVLTNVITDVESTNGTPGVFFRLREVP